MHGIVRFIPLYRKDIFGNRKKIDFEITNVQKNEKTEQYKTESDGDNRKIYVGEGDVNLDSGVYNYVITYQSHGHVGFFNKYDELYWNVTGNEWNFNIQKLRQQSVFPNGAVLVIHPATRAWLAQPVKTAIVWLMPIIPLRLQLPAR